MTDRPAIEPDTKNWTWVLERPCPDCGFDPTAVHRLELGARIRRNAALWPPLLEAPDAGRRPAPDTWSTLEYAAHVRDVHRVFGVRLTSMLAETDPLFPNWDQDAAALEGRYADLDPTQVGRDLLVAAEAVAATYDAVPHDAWARSGRRSNGSEFTVESLGRYQLHDLLHHAWDVRDAVTRATIASYDAHAADYGEATAALPESVRARLDRLVAAVGAGSRVLEIGSGAGRDATYLEEQGLSVRRTDITPGFVELMRAAGHAADVVDPLLDPLDDPAAPGTPYAGVWANACLLHVARTDLPVVLGRLAAVTRPGGALLLALKEGDGEGWSTHGSVTTPRRFVYWRADDLSTVVSRSGWRVDELTVRPGHRGESWILLDATRQ